jgi:two-component system sensor histidine kinase UhpB
VWEFSCHTCLLDKGRRVLSIDELRAVFAAAPDGFLVVRADGTIRVANEKVEQLFGWSADELEGMPVEMLLPESLHERHRRHRASFTRSPHDRPMGAGLDLQARRRDGREFPVEVSLSPWHTPDGEMQVICSVRDVRAVRRLQNFSEGALHASEEERKRIARELHDDTAQRLATLILRVRQLASESNDPARMRLFEEVRAEIVEAADEVKRMARGLRPPEIEELGLALAIQAHVRTLRESGALRVYADIQPIGQVLSPTAKLALYRIVQEALSNVRRHSGAPSATVRLRREDGHVVAEVSDRGQGFPLATTVDGQQGLGLVGMQERATMIGGRLTFESVPGEGTRVRVSVPVDIEEQNG